MRPIFRLDSVSPALADRLRASSPAKQRQAALISCELAVASAELSGKEVSPALDEIRGGATAHAALAQQLESLAMQLDDEYLRLDEEGDESSRPEMLRMFSKARAASALSFALSGEPHEAIYEALAAVEHPDGVIAAIEGALR